MVDEEGIDREKAGCPMGHDHTMEKRERHWEIHFVSFIFGLLAAAMVSDGGGHSHITHRYALLETAKDVSVPHVYIHFFFDDGRDTAPRSSAGYPKALFAFIEKEKDATIWDFLFQSNLI
ncbi:hypothetical protein EW146_g5319 [Bondarzewia mesenterica]|uniref:phosphoglycerate mutase (2,3-diphosphoglycerate-independent) n=1 Tax=Bondarzewia mesenterica TaxID=1095465 RepID=A0A4S4LRT9_9AGAM|nr:hypothetical protein EW146_g5319 [Bondarzewia mesenterica]